MGLKINGVARGQYKQLCKASWLKCKKDESKLSFKIRRAIELGKETYEYRNDCKIIRYYDLNFLVGENEIMTIWRDSSRPMYIVSEELKNNHKNVDKVKDIVINIPDKEDLHEKGFNKNIKVNPIITAEALIEYGFTNYREPSLYYSRNLGNDISFNLSINKESLEVENISVLDEDFLQHYDYQAILKENSNHEFAKNVYFKVNDVLSKLQDDKVIIGFEVGMYV